MAKPVIITEYGHAGHQDQALVELATAGVTEPTYLYSWRAKDAGAVPAYDVAGVALATLTPPSPHPTEQGGGIWPPGDPGGGQREAGAVSGGVGGVGEATGRKRVNPPSDYATQIDPQGSGEERCGEACGASAQASLLPGDFDLYQLMRRWTAALNDLRAARYGPLYVQRHGTTSADLAELAPTFGLVARTWTTWDEAQAAWKAGEVVLALLQNRLLRPRAYPDTAGWTETAEGPVEHWVRIDPLAYAGRVDGVYLLALDPLVYLVQRDGGVYQGPVVYTIGSVREAIAATPFAEAGVVLARGPTAG